MITARIHRNSNSSTEFEDEQKSLIPSNETKIQISSETSSHYIEPLKLGANSFMGASMIIIGTIMYGIFGIISRLSMLGRKSTPYQSAAAMILAECFKFIASILMLFNAQGIKPAIQSLKNVPYKEWFLFALPASLYSITNNLDFYILKYMDPGSMQVLVQSKIITTAFLWWYAFRKPIDIQQCLALFLLCIGSMMVAWPKSMLDDNDINASDLTPLQAELAFDMDNNSSITENLSMYVEWPMGPFFVGIQICLSAIAGIFTEWVYKKYGHERSIHVDNLSMYFWGTTANLIQFLYMKDVETPSLFSGFNYWTWLLIAVYTVKGLAISQVMKYFSNIVKLFMTGASIILAGLLTWMVFGLDWTFAYLGGLLVVTLAVLLYKTQMKFL